MAYKNGLQVVRRVRPANGVVTERGDGRADTRRTQQLPLLSLLLRKYSNSTRRDVTAKPEPTFVELRTDS